MADYQSRSRIHSVARPADAQFLPRTSHYSHQGVAGSTMSWVQNTQQNPPGPPPPQPIDLPSPVRALRPLPNPFPTDQGRAHGALHVVNTTESVDHNVTPSEDFNLGVVRPRKKKSFVGGFVKGIRRLPKAMFRATEKNKPKRQGTLETEGTSSSVGNTFPLYTSNPVIPFAVPGRPGLNVSHRPPIILSEPTIPESPPPAVVRLSDDQRKRHPGFRVAPPPSDSLEPEENSELFSREGPHFNEHVSSEGSVSNPAERTTVMVYEPESQYYGRNSHEPMAAHPGVAHQVSSPGLSYVSEPLTLAPVRPASFHSTHLQAPPPIEVPQRVPTPAAVPRVSYASQTPPRRAMPQSLIPGAFPASSLPQANPQAQDIPQIQDNLPAQHNMQAQNNPQSTPQHVDPPPVEPIQSPVIAHPEPTADYLKMTLSPSPTSHNTITTRISYFRDPSFSSDLNPVERFFKMLYNMPWVSHDRVTVDYLPGEGLGKMKKRKFRPMSSWYKSMIARSRRSSATLDLLSSGTGTETSPHTSLGTSVALSFGPPLSGSRRSRRSSDKKRIVHQKSHHHSSSRHHRHHSHSSHQRRRHTTTTMDTTDTEAQKFDKKHSGSPLIPAVYPFQYPPYPYQAFPTFPMPANVAAFPAQGQASQSHARERPVSPRGPRGEQHQQQQPMMYPAGGYAAFQQMMAPPQVYVLHPTSSPPMQANASVPPALVPGPSGGQGHDSHVANQVQNLPGSF